MLTGGTEEIEDPYSPQLLVIFSLALFQLHTTPPRRLEQEGKLKRKARWGHQHLHLISITVYPTPEKRLRLRRNLFKQMWRTYLSHDLYHKWTIGVRENFRIEITDYWFLFFVSAAHMLVCCDISETHAASIFGVGAGWVSSWTCKPKF